MQLRCNRADRLARVYEADNIGIGSQIAALLYVLARKGLCFKGQGACIQLQQAHLGGEAHLNRRSAPDHTR